mgnify:CR=1 FL=1
MLVGKGISEGIGLGKAVILKENVVIILLRGDKNENAD